MPLLDDAPLAFTSNNNLCANFPLLHDEPRPVTCDNDLCANIPMSQDDLVAAELVTIPATIISMPQLDHTCAILSVEPVQCAQNKLFHPINSAQEEFNLLSSLDTLGYIEFDVPCNLNCFRDRLNFGSDLPCFNCSFHTIGKYDNNGEYLVHRVYICSNSHDFPGLQHDNLVRGCTNTNVVLQNSFSVFQMQQVQHKEGEHWSCPIVRTLFPDISGRTSADH